MYEATVNGVTMWAKSELEHVGRITGVKDESLQKSYALSTLNGMAHLRNALFQLVNDPEYSHHKKDLLKTHNNVIRVMKHLMKDYDISKETIKKVNVYSVLGDLSYLSGGKRKTRKNRKN
jgi:hypothetical protein